MGLTVVDTEALVRLFTFIRDGDFDWTVADVPRLAAKLGWTAPEEVSANGAIANTGWLLPEDAAWFRYNDSAARSVNIPVTTRASDDPVERLAVIDAFAAFVATATGLLGAPARTSPGEVPRAQWRLPNGSVTIKNFGSYVRVSWASNEYQAFNESLGRY